MISVFILQRPIEQLLILLQQAIKLFHVHLSFFFQCAIQLCKHLKKTLQIPLLMPRFLLKPT